MSPRSFNGWTGEMTDLAAMFPCLTSNAAWQPAHSWLMLRIFVNSRITSRNKSGLNWLYCNFRKRFKSHRATWDISGRWAMEWAHLVLRTIISKFADCFTPCFAGLSYSVHEATMVKWMCELPLIPSPLVNSIKATKFILCTKNMSIFVFVLGKMY